MSSIYIKTYKHTFWQFPRAELRGANITGAGILEVFRPDLVRVDIRAAEKTLQRMWADLYYANSDTDVDVLWVQDREPLPGAELAYSVNYDGWTRTYGRPQRPAEDPDGADATQP